MPQLTDRLPRLHVWAPVAFAHLRAHRCGVVVRPTLADDDIERLCHETPIYRAEVRPLPPFPTPVLALCARHGAEARGWDTVTRLTSFRPLATAGED